MIEKPVIDAEFASFQTTSDAEDSMDELDDVLDAMATELSPCPSKSGPGRPQPSISSSSQLRDSPSAAAASTETTDSNCPLDNDLAKTLEDGMATIMQDIKCSPGMQKQFEEIFKELKIGTDENESRETRENSTPATPCRLGKSKDSSSPSATFTSVASSTTEKTSEMPDSTDHSFQDNIRRTMERMKTSGEAATAASASTSAEDDMLAQMISEMERGGFTSDGNGGDGDISKMLMGMMEQLTNKDILYDPMKELHDKFPDWLEKNRGKIEKKDLIRYEEQQGLINEIVGKFEEVGYSDENPVSREYVVERMQKMQAAGSPPPDLVGDMNAAQEALDDIDSGCPTQ